MTTTSKFVGGKLEFFDTVTFERVLPVAPVVFYQDFLGAGYQAIPAAGSADAGGDFVAKIVGAGPPTVAFVANAIGGQVGCTLTATSEKAGRGAVLGRQPRPGRDQGRSTSRPRAAVGAAERRRRASRLGAGIGLDRRAEQQHLFLRFGATANGAVLIQSFDGVTTVSTATGVTVLTTEWHIYRIDANNVADVKFFIDGVQVGTPGW